MHLILTKQCPDYMKEITSLNATNATRTGLRSSHGLSFRQPMVRTKFGERAIQLLETTSVELSTILSPVNHEH